ncbi:CAP domain-containing protein [Streptomyces pinistramenti]|uniref:CAP domain-containing protein n=1 Tax=Streptomyces pinistramenti TaxID=2884812 RepID=UPI001D0972C4|nr:CAP domain-containing protein [Streptomyces pinistramenti]MCB5910770.1 CAP domain-containing protein [Streptomyces pinistramenti]
MGRHRRSAPHAPEPVGAPPVGAPHPAEPVAQSRGHRAARGRRGAPVRTGLLGASAAVAMGTVAVASGLLPGGGPFDVSGGDRAERVRADALPDTGPQGTGSAAPAERATDPASRAGTRPAAPGTGRPSSAVAPSATPSPGRSASSAPARDSTPQAGRHGADSAGTASATPGSTASASPRKAPAAGTSTQAQVLSLVNQERADAGCSPVRADGELASLAQAFSDDMAARDFFDHTDPDGASPWDRARKAGISDLGGENIARGQSDARAVMKSWMNSPGHRANILNCDYRTLGVGVHTGPGGPWWTQDFGF